MGTPLGPEKRKALADSLGDSPETAIPVHLLRRGLCDAYLAGDPSDYDAAVVQPLSLMAQPFGFGGSAEALWGLLSCARGWRLLHVAWSLGGPLGAVMERETGVGVRYYGDVYHTLTRPVSTLHAAAVRKLTLRDLPILEAAPAEVQGDGFGDLKTLLKAGIAAGAVVEGRLVAIAHTNAITDRHADIGVSTLEPWRGRGFATAAASIVTRRIQGSGRTPVWSAGEDNFASLRVARKLGFVEVSRGVYVGAAPMV